MFAIPKKVVDGVIVKARFVVDPLHINEHIPTVDYPLPQIADIHELIGGARFYSTLDLESGYHQFWVADADRPKTAITVDNVRYKFHRCPFGFKHLPAIFQRVMNGLLRDLLYVLVYIDDVIVWANSPCEMATRLKVVIDRLNSANLRINFENICLGAHEHKILGVVISEL